MGQSSNFLSLPRDIMDKIRDVHHYKQETTRKGSMKIEVVVEEAKKPKKERPGSASSIRNIEDIQKRQKAAEERRRQLESVQMASLAEKQKKAEEVRAKKATIVETSENSCDN